MNKQTSYLKIGLLTETQNNNFPNELMRGVQDAIADENIILIRFMSLNPRDEQELYINKEILTHIIKSARLDGLLFLGWLYDFQNEHETWNFIKQFTDIPLVSMGKPYPNIPSVSINCNSGMRDLILHLIEVHGYKNIAFINSEVEDERFEIYQSVMKEKGLYKTELVVRSADLKGIYFRRGEIALSLLMDERKVKLDTVVSLDENNAIAIIDDLKKRRIKVPQEIAVTSYEDGERGKYYHPSLTTIPYSFYDIGYYACKKLIKIFKKEEYIFSEGIVPEVIYRRSCGCQSPLITHFIFTRTSTPYLFHLPPDAEEMQSIIEIIRKESGCPYTDLITEVFIHSISVPDKESVFYELLSELIERIYHKEEIYLLQQCLSSLHNIFFPGYFKDQAEMFRAELILHQARLMLAEAIEALIGKRLVKEQLITRLLLKLAREFGNAFDKGKLVQLLQKELPLLEMKSCYLSLYKGNDFEQGVYELYFAYKDYKQVPVADEERQYPSNILLPEKYLCRDEKRIYIYQPLFFLQEFLGAMIFEAGLQDLQIYRVLSEMFSSALKGSNLLKSLEKIYMDLKDTQKELVAKARKAGMAEIAISILHNIGNILNSVTTSVYTLDKLLEWSPVKKLEAANEILTEKLPELEVLFKDDIKMSSLLKYYISLGSLFTRNYHQICSQLDRINQHSELLNKIIISQENFAGTKFLYESMDLTEIINAELNEFSDPFVQFSINVVKEFSPEIPRVLVQKAKVAHILTSIITNAIDAVIDSPDDKRNIMLFLFYENNKVILKIKDTGYGMPGEVLRNIFQLGFTTKKKGSGFNLHYCANFMSEMRGRISAHSDGPGQGAVFTLEFREDRQY